MKNINRFVKIGVAILIAGALAVPAAVYAEREDEGHWVRGHVRELSYKGPKGSISVGKARESAFPGMAKVSFQEAMQTAVARVSGEVLKVELAADENGYLVYSVEIVSLDKAITDVKIDAGSGDVLALEKVETITTTTEGRK